MICKLQRKKAKLSKGKDKKRSKTETNENIDVSGTSFLKICYYYYYYYYYYYHYYYYYYQKTLVDCGFLTQPGKRFINLRTEPLIKKIPLDSRTRTTTSTRFD